jgi:PEP-CTERM motif
MSIRKLALGVCLALPLLSAPAWAGPTYTWNTTGDNSGSQLQFSASGYPSELVKVRAYSVGGTSSGDNFTAEQVNLYSGGLGVRTTSTSPDESSSSPQHSTDNSGRYEFLLFEFDSTAFKATGFEIGWKDTDADIQVWVGGTSAAGLNLASANAACGGTGCDFTDLGALGFVAAGTFENVQTNTFNAINTNTTGRYVLIAGKVVSNDSWKDYFKLDKIKGTESTSVPEPSSMLLAAAALLGIGGLTRRRRPA